MKDSLLLPLAAVVALAVGAASTMLGDPARARAADSTTDEAAALTASIAELRTQQQALAARLAALESAPAPAAQTERRAPARDLDQAIADYMARQLTRPVDDSAAPVDDPEHLEVLAIADRILSGQVNGDELSALWQKLRDEKRIDAVVAEIERQAALAPNNPDLQTQLGAAYVQKVFDVGMGPLAGVWSQKADQAFDHALELDDTHWEARFRKAMSLSNAPAFLGRQKEAVQQFETLVDQQERATSAPEHARTYCFLGNLYDQNGDHEKALAMWRRGLTRFPDDENLRGKIGGAR